MTDEEYLRQQQQQQHTTSLYDVEDCLLTIICIGIIILSGLLLIMLGA